MSIVDTLIVLIFLIFLCFFGFYQSKKNSNQKDFFLAGKNIGWNNLNLISIKQNATKQ